MTSGSPNPWTFFSLYLHWPWVCDVTLAFYLLPSGCPSWPPLPVASTTSPHPLSVRLLLLVVECLSAFLSLHTWEVVTILMLVTPDCHLSPTFKCFWVAVTPQMSLRHLKSNIPGITGRLIISTPQPCSSVQDSTIHPVFKAKSQESFSSSSYK